MAEFKWDTRSHGNPNRKVFLSYSSGGEEGVFIHGLVEQLYQDLSTNGCQVWGFERDSVPGTPFRKEYKQIITGSDFMVIFCNDSARSSDFIREEIETALKCAKSLTIIPVLLDKKSPHPLLNPLCLAAIPYYDKDRRNRVYFLYRVLIAMGLPPNVPPNDKFNALGFRWKVYQRDPKYYPICNPNSIRLLGSESSRMDIQTEEDFIYPSTSVLLRVESGWRTDTSIGFEKWYERDRYSISLQSGNVWVRWRGWFGSKSKNFPVKNWQHIQRKKLTDLRIKWGETETVVFVNDLQTCWIKTQVHRPLKLRLNADINDYIVVTYISWDEKDEMKEVL